ncbi:hypothetical protein D3C75_1183840 [compost metagenome]
MYRLGEQLLAGAAFAQDQCGRVTATGDPSQVQRVLNGSRSALNGFEGVAGLSADDPPGNFPDASVLPQRDDAPALLQ